MSTPYPQQPPSGEWGATPPHPPPGQPGGPATIAVTTKFFWLAWMLFFIEPKLFLNGHALPVRWGRNEIPVQPGQHHLHLYVPYFLPPKIGPAELSVPVWPGQTVELEYRAPVWTFSRGALGPPPQPYHGIGITIGVMAGALVLFCLCCGVGALTA